MDIERILCGIALGIVDVANAYSLLTANGFAPEPATLDILRLLQTGELRVAEAYEELADLRDFSMSG